MRYIGTVNDTIKDKELNHLKTLLEREVIVRSVKHLVNMYLRDVSDTHLSAVLGHLFNILFAPFPLLARLEDGSFAYPSAPTSSIDSIATSQELKQQAPEASSKPEVSKKKQKKASKKEKQGGAGSAPADLGEMLLKNEGAGVQPFAVEGLFVDQSVFKGLIPLENPEVLSLKPSQLYAKIRVVARQRYGYILPEKQTELRCL
jgi:hypothetical protein